jgi:hypothetical protein
MDAPARSFSHEVRVLLCAACGAPLDASLEGGSTPCRYCNAINLLERRNEDGDIAEAEQARAAALDESERIERLRQQDGQPMALPPGLQPFLCGRGLAPERAAAAVEDWSTTRKMLEQTQEFTASERLFHLTLLVAPTLEPNRRRAMIENAVELLPDRRHRQVLRAELCQLAVRSGDLEAAERWLRPCNSRSSDLRMDTAYRLAAGYLALGRGEFLQVLALLGRQANDLPIADGSDVDATALRATATEALSGASEQGVRQCREQLEAAMAADLRSLHDLDRAFERLDLAPRGWPLARAAVSADVERSLRSKKETLASIIIPAVMASGFGFLSISAAVESAMAPAIAMSVPFLLFALITAAMWASRKQRARLLRDGALGFAEVLSATRSEAKNRNVTTVSHVLEVVLAARAPTRHSYSAPAEVAPGLGFYPCISMPEDAKDNFLLELTLTR